MVEISAHPVVDLYGEDRKVTVTNVVSDAAPDGSRRIFFTVKNVGMSDVNYRVCTSWIGP